MITDIESKSGSFKSGKVRGEPNIRKNMNPEKTLV